MQSENTTNNNWKNGLEDATLLPGETLQNKDVTYKKLNQRLHAKPRHKRAVAYWLAAACVLLALLTPFIYLPKTQNTLVKNTTKKAINKSEPQILQPTKKEIVTTTAIPVFIGKKNTAGTAILVKKATVTKPDSVTNFNVTAAEIVAVPKEVVQPVLIVDSSAAINVVAALQKKKLQVVHINELGDPIAEPGDIASSTEQHLLPWKLGNGAVFTNPEIAYRHSVFPLLKTKPSTSN